MRLASRSTTLSTMVAAVALLGSCGPAGGEEQSYFQPKPLARQQAQDELRTFGVTISETYIFVSAVKTALPGRNSVDYRAVYESPWPPKFVLVSGKAVKTVPDTCAGSDGDMLPDGLGCSWVTEVRRGWEHLAKNPSEISVISAKLPSGQLRIYVAVLGR